MKAKDFVNGLNLGLNVTRRFDCPECGRKHTFSVTKTLEGTKWYCFSAHCGTKGVIGSNLSLDQVKEYLEQQEIANQAHFDIPEYWINGNRSPSTIKYLREYNVLDRVGLGGLDVKYDPKQDRHVLLSRKGADIIGVHGRANFGGVKPKWYNYFETDTPFTISRGDNIGIIVEDCVSAAAVSFLHDGIALAGTYLKDKYMSTLSQYDKLIVCLDKDASKKALDMQLKLCYYSDTKVVLLERDLKYLTRDEIINLFEGI